MKTPMALPPLEWKEARHKPSRFKQTSKLEKRLAEDTYYCGEQIKRLLPGVERDHVLREACRTRPQLNISGWSNSPGLKAPS
jgi:hypothetical protein